MPSDLTSHDQTQIPPFSPYVDAPKVLDPLPKKIDVEYGALNEEVKIEFAKCDHKKAALSGDTLRCPCGAAWKGPGIEVIAEALAQQNR